MHFNEEGGHIMKMIKLVERNLSKETSVIEHFIRYTDNKTPFVCIGGSVIVPVSTENSSDLNKMLIEAEETMKKTLHSFPDFSNHIADDGRFVVIMHQGPVVISPKKYEEYNLDEDASGLGLGMDFV